MRAAGVIAALAWVLATPFSQAHAGQIEVQRARLENGLEVAVIPDHRIPVVTHVIAYRAGAVDDPPGASGLAHFVEHLMYKSTTQTPAGVFARTISRLGGRENAATSHDTTMYYQRVPREALSTVMALEADRMGNLRFDDDEVQRERDVIIEERRQRIDLSPINVLNEQVAGALHPNHHYRVPVLGWRHEMSQLTRGQAEAFYSRHYRPDNAVLVVQGDVELDEVLELARNTYGKLRAGSHIEPRPAIVDPEAIAPRRIELSDPRVAQAALLVSYFVPLTPSAAAHTGETVEILLRILAQGDSSRLSRRLVTSDRLATSCEGGAQTARDGITLSIFATAVPGADTGQIQTAVREEIARIAEHGVLVDEIERARSVIEAADLFAADQQFSSTLRVAEAIANGRAPADISARSQRLAAVSAGDIQSAAKTYLSHVRSVTGVLLPGSRQGAPGLASGGAGR